MLWRERSPHFTQSPLPSWFGEGILVGKYPTTNGGMQNGSSVGVYTRCIYTFFARLVPICLLSRCILAKKNLRRSSRGSLLRVHCWLGSIATWNKASTSSLSPVGRAKRGLQAAPSSCWQLLRTLCMSWGWCGKSKKKTELFPAGRKACFEKWKVAFSFSFFTLWRGRL